MVVSLSNCIISIARDDGGETLNIGKPIAVEHVFKLKFDPETGRMVGGQNIPEEFKKLFADILADDPKTAPRGENRGQSEFVKRRIGALDDEDYEALKKESESLVPVDFITDDPSKVY